MEEIEACLTLEKNSRFLKQLKMIKKREIYAPLVILSGSQQNIFSSIGLFVSF